jgi:DNA-binding GntR family transcriptional regulator
MEIYCSKVAGDRLTESLWSYMAPIFQKIEPVSKKARLVSLLREAIVSGAIETGEQIVEGKLAQQFGVGQGLIREALIELEHQGFVQRTPFSGTQVSKLSLEDAQQIFDIRIELEPLAFVLAGQKFTPPQLNEVIELAEKAKRGAKPEDLDLFFEAHLAFRKRIWELSGNRYLKQTLERVVIPLYALYLIRGSHNRQGLYQTVIDCIEHQDKIVEAYKRADNEEAKRVAREFLSGMKEYLGTRLLPTP